MLMKTIEEIRRENLLHLAAEAGGVTKLSGIVGKSQSQLSQLLLGSPDSKSRTGKPKEIGSKIAREIEAKLQREIGWMDHDRSQDKASPDVQTKQYMAMPNDAGSSHIGERLREAIKAKGVTQADVARHFDVTPATVSSDWIKLGRIGKRHIPELVNYFGLPYEFWLGCSSAPAKGTDGRIKLLTSVTNHLQQMREEDVRLVADMCARLSRKTGSAADERKAENEGYVVERRNPFGAWHIAADETDTSDYQYLGATDYQFDSEEEAEQQRKNDK